MNHSESSMQLGNTRNASDEVAAYIQHAQNIAGRFSQRKGKKPVNPLGVKDASPIKKTSHKRSGSLNSHQIGVANGTKGSQALRRDSPQPSRILWASEASWLSAALDQFADQPGLHKIDEEDTLVAGAKVVYFVYNDINDTNIESLLRNFGALPTDGLKFARVCDEFKRRRSKWQGAIIGFVEVLVANTLLKWVEENPRRDLMTLRNHHRQQIWEHAYDQDPAGVATAMWKPVGGVIEWGQVFGNRPQGRSDADHEKIINVRIMLKIKFMFACEEVFQWRFNGGLLPETEVPDHRSEGVSSVSSSRLYSIELC